jgi:hypothetical protein
LTNWLIAKSALVRAAAAGWLTQAGAELAIRLVAGVEPPACSDNPSRTAALPAAVALPGRTPTAG